MAGITPSVIAYPVKLPWIIIGAPLKVNGAPENIVGNLTGMCLIGLNLDCRVTVAAMSSG